MSLPVVELQVDFAHKPLETSRTWTTLVALTGATVNRGRNHLASRFDAGDLSADLDNADNRYDPLYTTGPYGAALTPQRPVRLMAGPNAGALEPLFTGFVDEWAINRLSQGRSAAKLTAHDIFKMLAGRMLRDTAYYDLVNALAASPSWFWRLNDKITPSATNIAGAFAAVRGPDLGQWFSPERADGPLVADPDPGVHIDADKGYIQGGTAASELGVHNAYSVVFWLKTSSTGITISSHADPSTNPSGTAPIIWTFQDDGAGNSVTAWGLWLGNLGSPDNTTVLIHAVYDPVTTGLSVVFTGQDVVINDGEWHLVAVTRDSSATAMHIYVDGVVVASAGGAIALAAGTQQDFYIGHDSAGPTGGNHIAFDVKDMAWWMNHQLSTADILALYNAGVFPSETVGDRLARCLDIVGVPGAWRSLAAGPTLQTYKKPLYGTSALAHMQTCVDSEGGQLFTAADGTVTYYARTRTPPAVSVTFSDAATGSEVPYQSGTGPVSNDDDVYNDVEITGDSIQPVSLTDATSIDTFGQRTMSLSDCQLAAQSDANTFGSAMLARLKDATPRTPSVAFTAPDTSSPAFTASINRELMERATYKEMGPIVQAPATQTAYIEHISHEYVPTELFKSTYALSAF